MSGSDLDWLFSPAGELASAQKQFADRLPQQQAFDRAVAACRLRLDPGSSNFHDPQDLGHPRRNVLHFYGMGGIGKSELLDRLRRRAAGVEPRTKHWTDFADVKRTVPAFYDFKRQMNPTPEGLLLTVRQQLAAGGYKCPAFDLLIARYWAANHPGESLQSYIAKRSNIAGLDDSTGLSKQIETSVGEVVTSLLGIGFGVSGESVFRLAKSAAAAITEFGPKRTALRDCRRLEDLLRAPASAESLPYYASALSWDLTRIRTRSGEIPLLVVFIDHFEEIDEHVELMLQQIIWLLPNALFVTSGRNFLRWAGDRASGLFRAGRACWPLLVDGTTEEPRQHRVGPLSSSDTMDFLSHALVGNELTVSEREDVATASGGLPYHLDLMVQHWATVHAGRQPQVSDLLVPFPDLARRVMRDLDHRERKLVYACTLFDRFDSALLAEVADVDDGVARDLLMKPLFQERGHGRLNFALDRTLRAMFLDLAEEGQEDWSSADWRRVANRALAIATSEGLAAPATGKRFWLAQGLQIAIAFGLEAEPLLPIAGSSVDGLEWTPSWKVSQLRSDCPTSDCWAADYAAGLATVFSRQSRSRDSVATDLEGVLIRHPDDPRFDVIRYFAAEALRDVGQVFRSHRHFETLIRSGSALSGRANHGRIHLLRRQGRIRHAIQAVRDAFDDLPAPERLMGEILWTQGEFDAAADSFLAGYRSAKSAGKRGEMWICAAFHAFSTAWTRPDLARELLEKYEPERLDYPSSFSDGLVALTELLTSRADEQELAAAWTSGRNEFRTLRQTSPVCYFDLAAVYLSKVSGFSRLGAGARTSLAASSADASMPYLNDIAAFIVCAEPSSNGIEWLDDDVAGRWRRAVESRARALTH